MHGFSRINLKSQYTSYMERISLGLKHEQLTEKIIGIRVNPCKSVAEVSA